MGPCKLSWSWSHLLPGHPTIWPAGLRSYWTLARVTLAGTELGAEVVSAVAEVSVAVLGVSEVAKAVAALGASIEVVSAVAGKVFTVKS